MIVEALMLVLLLSETAWATEDNNRFDLTIRMPETRGKVNKSMLCTSVRMPQDTMIYINRIQPKGARLDNYHHIGVWGCEYPGLRSYHNLDLSKPSQVVDPSPYWNCMDAEAPQYQRLKGCRLTDNVRIFASDKVDEVLQFPEGTGHPVGRLAGLDYMVITTHLLSPTRAEDDTRIEVSFLKSVEKNIGILDIQDYSIHLPPNSRSNTDCIIRVTDDVPRFIIGSYAHLHPLGDMSSVYKVDNGQWHLIYKGKARAGISLDKPKEDIIVNKGDILSLRCVHINPYNYMVTLTTEPVHERCLNIMWMTYDREISPKNIKKIIYNKCLKGKEKDEALNHTYFPEDASTL